MILKYRNIRIIYGAIGRLSDTQYRALAERIVDDYGSDASWYAGVMIRNFQVSNNSVETMIWVGIAEQIAIILFWPS